MQEATLIFPHQLYQSHPALFPGRPVILTEEHLFFRLYAFHKQKLVFHRASMQLYAEDLRSKGYKVVYIETASDQSDCRILMEELGRQQLHSLYYADTTDNWLEKRITRAAANAGIQCHKSPSPGFLNRMEEVEDYFAGRKTYFQTDFYIAQRKKRGLLLDANGKPLGGKWSFDDENRLRLPGNHIPPALPDLPPSEKVEEAIGYVESNFPGNPGTATPFRYPVTHIDAMNWLQHFLQYKLALFGPYEDAMHNRENFLYHSLLTPALNTGLLTPQEVLGTVLDYAEKHPVPLNSLEGFIRQLTGWREFIRIVYEREGSVQRTRNYWGFSRKIPASFWTGQTGIGPVDTVIRRVLRTGYCHHIERLMVLGNFMLLCEFDPDEVYRWFMEMFIDSYDWVMVPNIYGMTQFADGGLMTTKPYISGSNYLLKMGHWEKGPWQETWDGLFWRFMHVHRDFFGSNPRLGMLLKTFDKMSPEKQKKHLEAAEIFLQKTAG